MKQTNYGANILFADRIYLIVIIGHLKYIIPFLIYLKIQLEKLVLAKEIIQFCKII